MMKLRIRYTYEQGNESFLVLLLESKSLADMINRAEYAMQMTEYDRQMMEKLKETQAQIEAQKEELEQEFPVMTLRNMVMFPSVVMPITAGRRTTLKLVNAALKNSSSIVIATQKLSEVENPGYKDLYPTAVIGKVLRVFELPGGNTTVILQANGPKVHLDEITSVRPYLKGKVTPIKETMEAEDSDEFIHWSECDGWGHLYLYDKNGDEMKYGRME